jgi:hypothetical protein
MNKITRIMLLVSTIALATLLLTSCAATKRDCQGVKHYKHKNGFYI